MEKLVSESYINYNILLILVTIPAKIFDGAKSQNVWAQRLILNELLFGSLVISLPMSQKFILKFRAYFVVKLLELNFLHKFDYNL